MNILAESSFGHHLAPEQSQLSNRPSSALKGAALALLPVLVLGLLLPSFWREPVGRQDEGMMLALPERILKGDLPYRDFQHPHGPAALYTIAVAFLLSEPSLAAERSVGLIYRLAIILGIFAFYGRRRVGSVGALASLVSIYCLIPIFGLIAWSWLGGAAAALWSLWYLTRKSPCSRSDAMFSGILAGLAVLFRPDLALATFLPPLVLLKARQTKIVFGVSALLAMSPYLWLAFRIGPAKLFDGIFLTALRFGGGRRLPLNYQGTSIALLFLIICLVAVLPLALGLGRKLNKRAASIGMCLFMIGLLPQMAQRADHIHILAVASIVIPLAPIALTEGIMGADYRKKALVLINTLLAAAIALTGKGVFTEATSVALQKAIGRVDLARPTPLTHRGRTVLVTSRDEAEQLRSVLDVTERFSRAGDRLFVGPGNLRRAMYNDTLLYFLLPQLEPATFFMEMEPGTANASDSNLGKELATADIVILNRTWDNWIEPNESSRLGPILPELELRRRFQLAATFGPYDLYLPVTTRLHP